MTYFLSFNGQVLRPNKEYNGQLLINAVKIGIIPISPIYLYGKSVKRSNNSAIPINILIQRSILPTFFFINITPFRFFCFISTRQTPHFSGL